MELNSIMEDSPLNGRRRNHPWKQRRSFSGSTPGSPIVVAKKPTRPWQQLWGDFEKTFGMHGIRRIKPKRRNIVVSTVWVILLLLMLGLFLYSITDRIMYYFSYETFWTMHRSGGAALNGWPAISICNLGPIRITKLKEHYLSDRKTKEAANVFSWKTFLEDNKNVPSRDFYAKTGHLLQDMIVRCHIQGSTCSVGLKDFSSTLTMDGLCYTLRPNSTTETIELWLNAETYDCLSDVQQAVGLKIYIHDKGESPVATDHYFYVSPGSHYDVTIAKESMHLLEYPYGMCMRTENYLYNKHCHANCICQHVEKKCSCSPFWLSKRRNDLPGCDLKNHFDCVQRASEEKSCMCHHGCRQEYHYSDITASILSDSVLSKYMAKVNSSKLAQRYQIAVNYAATLDSDYMEDDYIIKFNKSSHTLVDTLNRFTTSVTLLKATLAIEKENIFHRISFHTKVALGGMQKIINKGFSSAWNTLEKDYLEEISMDALEITAMFERSVQLMKSAISDRNYVYANIDSNLGVKMDIAEVIVDNLTGIHMSYLNAEPSTEYEITPRGRYDNSLKPSELITRNGELQTQYYNKLSGVLGDYINEIMTMQRILREVFQSGRTNDTTVRLAKRRFLEYSKNLKNDHIIFRDHVVRPVELEISNKIRDFKQLSMEYETRYNNIARRLDKLVEWLGSLNDSKISGLKQVTQFASSYVLHRNVSKSNLIDNTLSEDMGTMFAGLDEVTLEILLRLNDIFTGIETYSQALFHIWESILTEDSLSSFYFQLQKDVSEMQENSARTEFLISIFSDIKMLNLSQAKRSTLALKQYSTLLNADVPALHLNHKREGLNVTVQNFINSINYKTLVHQNILSVQQSFSQLQAYLKNYKSKITIDKSFHRRNLLSVKLKHSTHYYTHWTQVPAYTTSVLFAHIGMLLASMLGASVLSLFELCDIVVSWLLARDCCNGPKLENHSIDETSNKSSESRHRVNRTPSYTTDSLQSRETVRDSSRDYNKRPYVKFQECNHVRGSEV